MGVGGRRPELLGRGKRPQTAGLGAATGQAPGASLPFSSQVAVAADTEAFAFPTPMPSKTAWVAREPERLEAKACRRKETGEEWVGSREV